MLRVGRGSKLQIHIYIWGQGPVLVDVLGKRKLNAEQPYPSMIRDS